MIVLRKLLSNFTLLKLKTNPLMLRNAPPIGGSISWVRQMIKKIEKPMTIFKEHKYITNLTG